VSIYIAHSHRKICDAKGGMAIWLLLWTHAHKKAVSSKPLDPLTTVTETLPWCDPAFGWPQTQVIGSLAVDLSLPKYVCNFWLSRC